MDLAVEIDTDLLGRLRIDMAAEAFRGLGPQLEMIGIDPGLWRATIPARIVDLHHQILEIADEAKFRFPRGIGLAVDKIAAFAIELPDGGATAERRALVRQGIRID